jgi:acetyl esterase/lipase
LGDPEPKPARPRYGDHRVGDCVAAAQCGDAMAQAGVDNPERDGSLTRWLAHLLRWSSRASSASRPPETARYGSHPEQVADLWMPDGPGPHPVVVSIHGGYFRRQYRRDIHDPLARALVGSGLAVLNIEYRRVGTGGSWDHTTEDVMTAISWLSERRTRRGGLGDEVSLVGHSAGGYLALWAATHPDVHFVVGLSAVSDLADCARGGYDGGSVAAWLGAAPDSDPARYAHADLLGQLPTRATTWLVHGDADRTVPLHQSTRYVDRALQAGDVSSLRVLPGEGHFGVIDPRSPAFAAWHDPLVERMRG